MTINKTVFVGLSGGVDSSVSALRLKKAGYNVVGVFIKVWHPAFLNCNWEAERLDAMRVAAHLDIPFLMCDAEEAYKNEVADYFIAEYKAGRTPNPDVMCNKAVKFGVFMQFAMERGADYIATGHYVVRKEVSNAFTLNRGVDSNKDQSYFLWTLTQSQLAKSLFPVGDTPKHLIRSEAEKAAIPVATKDDSQGICFLGHVDIPDFLSHYIDLNEGVVFDTEGNTIGSHRGAFVYTLGQRHGFSITGAETETPHYIVAKDIASNTITVSTQKPEDIQKGSLMLHTINWVSNVPDIGDEITAQTRYRQKEVLCRITSIDSDTVTLEFLDTHEITAPGQSCVLYRQSECLGGGIISA